MSFTVRVLGHFKKLTYLNSVEASPGEKNTCAHMNASHLFIRFTWRASEARLLSTDPQVSDSVSAGWRRRICISNELQGDSDAAGTILGDYLGRPIPGRQKNKDCEAQRCWQVLEQP